MSDGPTSGPSPQTTWNRPFGRPACSSSSMPYSGESAVLLSGFTTTPLPAIRAGMASEMPVANGKFHGAMMPMTPRGGCTSVELEMNGTGPGRRLGASTFGARLR